MKQKNYSGFKIPILAGLTYGSIMVFGIVAVISLLILLLPAFATAVSGSAFSLVSTVADAILTFTGQNKNPSVGLTPDSFFAFKFILWAIVISIAATGRSFSASIMLLVYIILVILVLNIVRLTLFATTNINNGFITSGAFSLPYRIVLFIIPLAIFLLKGLRKGSQLRLSVLSGWRDNYFLIFIIAALAGSIPGLLYENGFFLFDWVIWVVFSIAKGLLAVFSVTATFTGRYLTNDHTSIYMSDSCAGLKTIIMLISLLLLGRGKLFHKIIFAVAGVIFLLTLNAIRVTILFEINNESSPARVFDWWHSNFKYLFYIAVMALWLFWLQIQRQISREPQE